MRRLPRLLVSILLLLGLIGIPALRVTNALEKNAKLEAEFQRSSYAPNGPYQQRLPMEDWESYIYINHPYTLGVMLDSWMQAKLTMPKTIRWYTQPDTHSEVVAVAEKGKEYWYFLRGGGEYSIKEVSWPTYQKGWRYVVPLYPAEHSPTEAERQAAKQYYVRLEDLEVLERRYLEGNNLGTLKSYVERGGNAIDRELYQRGYYISPDLYRNVWEWPDTLMAVGAVGILAFNVVVELRAKRRAAKPKAEIEA